MLIPLVSIPSPKPRPRRSRRNLLDRRKGGGGGGKSSGDGSGTSGESGTSGSSGSGSTGSTSSLGKTTSVPLDGSTTANGKTSATAYGSGGGAVITIPSGQLFAGRSAGGATRDEVFGTSTYGSGYPGITGRGVAGRGFPFWFWPVVWDRHTGVYAGTYLDDREYGDAFNTSRVGGPMMEATFVSNSTNSTFHVLADNSTVLSLITYIDANCSSSLSLNASSTTPQPFNASVPGSPEPVQAIQYFRASSIVLTLDGYNNSATLSNDTNAPNSPLPSGVDMTLLDCLNQTISLAAPLVDGANTRWTAPVSSMWLVGCGWVVWCLLHLV